MKSVVIVKAGGRKLINLIEKYERKKYLHAFKNLPHEDYLSLMKSVNLMIGNSSSGIIEAPSFKTPVINIGNRQQGRGRAKNVIDVGYTKNEIVAGIKKALFDKKFLDVIKKCESPYDDGKASEQIVNVLNEIEINRKLLYKKITY